MSCSRLRVLTRKRQILRERSVAIRPEDQATLLDTDPVPRRELRQVGQRELHGAGDVEDRLVAVAQSWPQAPAERLSANLAA